MGAHLALWSVLAIGSSWASAATQDQRFGLKQIFDLQWAADPRIAPNGKRVVFVRSGYDIMNDDTRHSLWVVGTDGNGLRSLTPPDEDALSLPAASADAVAKAMMMASR